MHWKMQKTAQHNAELLSNQNNHTRLFVFFTCTAVTGKYCPPPSDSPAITDFRTLESAKNNKKARFHCCSDVHCCWHQHCQCSRICWAQEWPADNSNLHNSQDLKHIEWPLHCAKTWLHCYRFHYWPTKGHVHSWGQGTSKAMVWDDCEVWAMSLINLVLTVPSQCQPCCWPWMSIG